MLHQARLLLRFRKRLPRGVVLLPLRYQLAYRARLLLHGVVVRMEHLHERPLCPMVETRVAGLHLAVPVVAEANLLQLVDIPLNVRHRGLLRVLSRLDGILLRGQTVGVEAHGVQHVEALQTLVAAVDIARNIPQRVSHMQACATRIRKHIQHVVVRLITLVAHAVDTFFRPLPLPLLLYFLKIIFHSSPLIIVNYSLIIIQ